jgi:hypothetical protein
MNSGEFSMKLVHWLGLGYCIWFAQAYWGIFSDYELTHNQIGGWGLIMFVQAAILIFATAYEIDTRSK